VYTPDHIAKARAIAAESFVLLKNQGDILPLKKTGTIALIGPLADSKENMPGTWSVSTDLQRAVTVRAGLTKALGWDGKIVYAKGSNLVSDSLYEVRATMFGRSLKRDGRSEEELRNEALAIAKNADVIVAALGEASEMSGESSSRTDLDIPDVQKRLLAELLKTGKPVVLVLFAGRPMTIKWEQEHVPAILNVWFGGSEAGNAIADVLFGDVNPSGKLTATFPQNVGQIPIYYAHKNTGRPLPEGKWFEKFRSNYIDVSNDPLYPFGYGLSYTKFDYGELELSAKLLKGNQTLTASITVTNKGSRKGKEVVQLYIRDMVGSVTRPVKELKGFQKIELDPGESRKVSFTITPNDLKFYDMNGKLDWESGDFQIMAGPDSKNVKTMTVNWNK
jgi:beta-glucosidase